MTTELPQGKVIQLIPSVIDSAGGKGEKASASSKENPKENNIFERKHIQIDITELNQGVKEEEEELQWKWEGINFGYWDMRGLGQRIRQLLEYLGLAYKEHRYEGVNGRNQWFNKHKPKVAKLHPAASLPFLADNEKVIVEPDAIQVYLCMKTERTDLMGRNFEEELALATAHSVMKDFYPHYINLCYGRYSENFTFEQEKRDTEPQFHTYLKKLNGLIRGKDFMAGGLTWVDFGIADFLQTLYIFNPDYFQPYPGLLAYQRRVWALPELEEYFSRRFKERPCNNYTATWK